MKRAIAARLIVLVHLSALLCGSQAMASDGPYKQVSGWSLYRNESNCAAYLLFENDEILGFAYDARGHLTRVAFTDAHETSQKDGDTRSLDVLLRYSNGTVDNRWESTKFEVAVDEDGRRTLTSRWLAPTALENFRKASFLGFFDKEREIAVFSLKGTAAALEEAKQCSMRLHDAAPRQ